MKIDRKIILVLVSLTMLVSACSTPRPGITPTLTAAPAATLTPTNIPLPSPTPTASQPEIILLAPKEADAQLADRLQAQLEEYAYGAGLSFRVSSQLSPAEISPQVRLVVVLPPDPGVAALAEAAAETQFLAVGIPGIQAGGNLSAVTANEPRPDQLAFVAGYLAAAMTPDWRVGIISPLDSPSGSASRLGFTNGVYFMCGLCRPAYPPFPLTGYPIVAQLSPGAGEADWQAIINDFLTWQVGSAYVSPEVAEDGLLEALANAGISIISASSPNAALKDNMAASIQPGDPAQKVNEILPALLEGRGGLQIGLPLELVDVNPDLLSPGRQGLVEAMLADLQEGFVDTGVDPTTGESRFTP